MKKLLGLALFLMAGAASAATTYYISASGALTDGSCTVSTGPYCSFGWAWRQTSHPDDTFIYQAGVYDTCCSNGNGSPYPPTNSSFGTSGHPVIHKCIAPRACKITNSQATSNIAASYDVGGAYQQIIGFEITSAVNANRVCSVSGSQCTPAQGIQYGNGLHVREDLGPLPGIVIANNYIHDTRQGITCQSATGFNNLIADGNIIQYNGWSAPDHGHGHGIYDQGAQADCRSFVNNISERNGSHGLQAFASSSAWENCVTLTGNMFQGNSDLPDVNGGGRELIIGGTNVAVNDVITGNFFYAPATTSGQLGWSSWPANSSTAATITGNYFVGADGFDLQNVLITAGVTSYTGNTMIYGGFSGYTTANFPGNTYSTPIVSYAGATKIMGAATTYDANECHVAIHNPSSAATVNVNTNTVCGYGTGDAINILYADNILGAAVLQTTSSASVAFPMTGLTMAAPAGNWHTPTSYAPKEAVFVVVRTALSSTPTPTNTPTFTATATPTPTFTPTPTNTPVLTATPTPTFTPTPTPAGGACTYIQAEAATLAGAMSPSQSDALAYGGQYIDSPTGAAGDTATFTFNLGAGTFYLNHRILSPSGANDSFFVSLDGAADTTHIDDTAEQLWSPSWQITRLEDRTINSPVDCSVDANRAGNNANCQFSFVIADSNPHTIRLRARDPLTKIDWLAICPTSALAPDIGATPTPTATPIDTNLGPLHWHRCNGVAYRHKHPPSKLLPHRHPCPFLPGA
jgi:hypothetical protein